MENCIDTYTIHLEQHIELRHSREKQDTQDIEKITDWLILHDPFGTENYNLISMSTGIIAKKIINRNNAVKIGKYILGNLYGKKLGYIWLKCYDKV